MAYFHTTVLDNQIKALPTVDTASGAIATFDTDLTENLVSVKCQIVAKQASGTPSPDNPLPITTYDSLTLYHNDINLWDEQWELGYIDIAIGQNRNISQVNVRSKNYIPIRPNMTLYLKANVGIVYCPVFYYDKDKNFLSSVSQTLWNRTITTPANAYYMRFYIHDSYGTTYQNDISINYPSTDTQYHAYNGTTANIPFGQTVANGVLDITTGKLRVTHENIASYNGESINEPWLSSMDVYVPNTTPTTGSQVVYPLTTPIEIQLDSITLQALLNENNIWCDTGDTSVKYLLTVGKAIS